MNLAMTASFLATHPSHGFLFSPNPKQPFFADSMTRLSMVTASESSQLAQLAGMTTLSIDSGDLKVIEEYAKTGYITDATTNPLFVSQAGLSGDPTYAEVCRMMSIVTIAVESNQVA
jgi:Transaldolase/Fructose-6-phosphate aldolase